ncbi:MAG: glycosyltransferase family 2 protein [Pseudomonadota bacterium]
MTNQPPEARSAVASVVVTFNPPGGLPERLAAALQQTDFVIVVDNGSATPPDLAALDAAFRDRIELIDNGRNIGLAAALNRGINRAAARGAGFALLLDHDSTPLPGMVETLRRAAAAHGRPAAAVPRVLYAHPDIQCRWPKSSRDGGLRFELVYASRMHEPTTVDLAISSGMLLDIRLWQDVGGFDESLFIDLVDTEFCLRARRHGHDILAVPAAQLSHHLGQVTKRMLLGRIPVFPTHHHPLRHYYLSRNRVILARRFAQRFPGWFVYEMLGAAKLTLKVALYEPQRLQKLGSMLRGTFHGARRVAIEGAESA